MLALRPAGLGLFFPEMQLHTFWMMMTVATQRALVVLFRFLIKVNQAMTHVLLAGMNCVPAISLLPAVNRTTAPSCEVVVQDQYFSLSLLQTSTNSANRAYQNNVQKSCALTHFYCTDDKWKLENETAFCSLMRRIKVRSSFFLSLSCARALILCSVR